MLTIQEDHWKVETVLEPGDRKVVEVTVSASLSTFEANRLARALQLAADHLETT